MVQIQDPQPLGVNMFDKKKKEAEKEIMAEPAEVFVPEIKVEAKPESRAMFLAKEELAKAKDNVAFWEGEIALIRESEEVK